MSPEGQGAIESSSDCSCPSAAMPGSLASSAMPDAGDGAERGRANAAGGHGLFSGRKGGAGGGRGAEPSNCCRVVVVAAAAAAAAAVGKLSPPPFAMPLDAAPVVAGVMLTFTTGGGEGGDVLLQLATMPSSIGWTASGPLLPIGQGGTPSKTGTQSIFLRAARCFWQQNPPSFALCEESTLEQGVL